MNSVTAALFILDIMSVKDDLKRNLNSIQIKKMRNILGLLEIKLKNKNELNEEDELILLKIYKSRRTNEINKIRQDTIKEAIENIKIFLTTGNINELKNSVVEDEIVKSINDAYKLITDLIKEPVLKVLQEPLTEKDIERLKRDNSKSAHIHIAKEYIKANRTKDEFVERSYITHTRLNNALSYVLSSDDKTLDSLKEQIIQSEMNLENEISLVEQLISNYDRREKNIKLIEFQSLTRLTVIGMLRELRERKSPMYDKLKEFFYEYHTRNSLQPIYFNQLRNTKTIINGRVLTQEDYDNIEKFIKDNYYPDQRSIYTAVKYAYVNGCLELLEREKLKRRVMNKFNLYEEQVQKRYK